MKYPLLFCSVLLFTTCADPVLPGFQLETGLYLVEGSIVDEPGESEVRVSLSELVSDRYVLAPVRNAVVTSIDDADVEITWRQNEAGTGYVPPAEFAAENGRAYRLRVTTADGTVIESQPETVPDPVPLADARIRFEQEGFFSQTLNQFVPTLFLAPGDSATATENARSGRVISTNGGTTCVKASAGQSKKVRHRPCSAMNLVMVIW